MMHSHSAPAPSLEGQVHLVTGATSGLGFATASVVLPAKRRPTARGSVETSSTMSDPESPPERNLAADRACSGVNRKSCR